VFYKQDDDTTVKADAFPVLNALKEVHLVLSQGAHNQFGDLFADGFCPACGGPAPIGHYLDIVRRFGGLLVLDDTQALGILGEEPGAHPPYGNGGGGVLRWSGHFGPDILVGASLAKGFGIPMAALAGSELMLRRFATLSDTRVHCSPPSVAVIHAAERALTVNRDQGNQLRQWLAQRVGQFRKGLELIGWSSIGGWFPVRTIRGIVGPAAVRLHQRLSQRGVQAVLSRPRNDTEARLSFLITARHSAMEIDRCIDMLDALANDAKTPTTLRQTPADLGLSADWLQKCRHSHSRGGS